MSRGKAISWDDEAVGSESKRSSRGGKRANDDVDLDLDGLGLADDDGVEAEEKPKRAKKAAKKAGKKTKKKAASKAKVESDDSLDLEDLGLADGGEESGIDPDSICTCGHRGDAHDYRTRKCSCGCEGYEDADAEEPVSKKKAGKKKAGKKKAGKKKAGKSIGCADDGESCDRSCEMTKVEKAASALVLDLSMECPVCRSLDPCECEEEDRSFIRRVRFEEDVKKVARCPRCGAPLSVIYLPRPGAALMGIIKGSVDEGTPPRMGFNLSQFEALWVCSCCHGEALATAVLSVRR